MSFDAWAAPGATPTEGWQQVRPEPGPSRWRADLPRAAALLAGTVLLGAPVGLLWSAVAPHYTVVFQDGQPTYPLIESTKAFIGADGSYAVVTLVAGLLTGAAGWWLARRSGPWTVLALAVGGGLAALVAARVGVLPGQHEAFEALSRKRGAVELFLGARSGDSTSLRAPWAAVVWPVAALVTFLVAGLVRPEELD